MRLTPADPDIQTLYARIEKGDINLQPDFQRGEVWGIQKKRRLIDSILRNWHVPPIHIVIVPETRHQEVLDGQQRLVAIRDFVKGEITVDGNTEPYNNDIYSLNGMRYDEIPENYRRIFDNFTIRTFRIDDYEPSEPGELFYRLNQPTNLTAAEQRNAFYGPIRRQVKSIVERFSEYHIDKDILGFSNSRMAYDDIIARVLYTLNNKTLREQISSSDITTRFRLLEPFPENILDRVDKALEIFGYISDMHNYNVRFNKATFYSWLCFIIHSSDYHSAENEHREIVKYIMNFELLRRSIKINSQEYLFDKWSQHIQKNTIVNLLEIFNDYSSARVANVQSVLIRDLILWFMYYLYLPDPWHSSTISEKTKFTLDELLSRLKRQDMLFSTVESTLNEIMHEYNWGATL